MNRPVVLIDGEVFECRTQLGIWRVFYEVMRRTSREIDYHLCVASNLVQPVPENVHVHQRGPRFDPVSRRQVLKRWIGLPRRLQLSRNFAEAIWHPTFYAPDIRPQGKRVVTVYDMIAESCYDIGPYEAQRHLKSRAIGQASGLLAISQYTAQQLEKFFSVSNVPVSVMHLGREHLIDMQTASALQPVVPGSYALFVGGRYAYKNFTTVIQAMAEPEWPTGWRLMVVGQPFDEAERSFIHASGCEEQVVHVGSLDDRGLAAAYKQAKCFIFPSRLEGFGIPVLEAQALGTPLVLSDTPVFREIAGDGAVFFQATAPQALAKSVMTLQDDAQRQHLIRAGLANCARFSWDKAAQVSIAMYESLWRQRPNS